MRDRFTGAVNISEAENRVRVRAAEAIKGDCEMRSFNIR